MRLCYISRNYIRLKAAGAIARNDVEITLEKMGWKHIGLRRSYYHNGLIHGLRLFAGSVKAYLSIRKGDVVVIQYPMTKAFEIIAKKARRRGAKVIAVVHDLHAPRELTITPERESKILNLCDVVLTHNDSMQRWLSENGCTARLVNYEIMDYLSGISAPHKPEKEDGFSLYFIGNASAEVNEFLYEMAREMPDTKIYVYGPNFDKAKAADTPNLIEMGSAKDTDLMAGHKGDFGIAWYGSSLDGAKGRLGEYMSLNNPHKVSLYLRCGTPVVVWKHAGCAKFLQDNGVDVSVDSLRELPEILNAMTPEKYASMCGKAHEVSDRIASGHHLRKAIDQALKLL